MKRRRATWERGQYRWRVELMADCLRSNLRFAPFDERRGRWHLSGRRCGPRFVCRDEALALARSYLAPDEPARLAEEVLAQLRRRGRRSWRAERERTGLAGATAADLIDRLADAGLGWDSRSRSWRRRGGRRCNGMIEALNVLGPAASLAEAERALRGLRRRQRKAATGP